MPFAVSNLENLLTADRWMNSTVGVVDLLALHQIVTLFFSLRSCSLQKKHELRLFYFNGSGSDLAGEVGKVTPERYRKPSGRLQI
jgi:hypothetical protein